MSRSRVRLSPSGPTRRSRRESQRPRFHFNPGSDPGLEALEARIVLSTVTWSGADSATSLNWTDGANWQGSIAPVAGDALVFPASASSYFPINDFAAGTSFASIDIQGTDYDLVGSSVELTGNLIGSLTSGASVYELATTLDSGVVQVASGGQLIASGKFSGSSGLQLTGGGGLSLRGTVANDYTGTTTVDSGTLTLDNLPSRYSVPGDLVVGGSGSAVVNESAPRQINPTSTLTVNTNGQFNVNGGTEAIGSLNLNGAAQIYTGTSAALLSGLLTIGGDVTADTSTSTSAIHGVINLGSSDRTFNIISGTLDISATVKGDHGLIKTGTGTLMMDNNTNQVAGQTFINAGVIAYSGGNAINSSASLGIEVASGATMQIYSVGPVSVPVRIIGSGAGGAGALHDTFFSNDNFSNLILTGDATIRSDSTGPTISNALVDGGSAYALTKIGSGRLTLSGANTYTGGTTINAGLLFVTGSIVGNVNVFTGGELGGSGTVGDVTTAGGTVGAGTNSSYEINTENYASITLDSTAIFSATAYSGTTPGSGYSQVVVSGAVALNDAALSLLTQPTVGFTPGPNNPLVLITGATSLTGTFQGLAEGDTVPLGSYNFKITYVGGAGGHDVILNRIVSTTTRVDVPADSSVFSQFVTFTARVTAIEGGTATGTVTFFSGATVLDTGTLSNGVATISTNVLPAGANSITAIYNGDELDLTSNSNAFPVTQVVIKDGSTTTLTVPGTSSVFGESITISALVAADAPGSGTPTGSISFFDGTTLLTTTTLVSGGASYSTTALAPGVHSFSASYAGDSGYFQSFSAPGSQTVNKASTTTTTPTSSGPSTFGESVTFLATVASVAPGSGIPTGTVTFLDGATSLGTATLDGSGVESFSTAVLAAGTHSITATYGGDPNDTISTSGALSQVISKSDTTTGLAASLTTVPFGQPVTLTATLATVAPGVGVPTGTVTFYDGATSLGTGTLDPTGMATLITASLGYGSRSVTAAYGGNANFQASTSSVTTISVSLSTPTIALTSPTNPTVRGQSVTLNVTVSPQSVNDGTPTGTVTFFDGATNLGSQPLVSGSASFGTSALSVGSHSITAVYEGDSSFQSVTSAATTQVVNKAASLATAPPPTAIIFGQSATLSVTVTAVAPGSGTPTGTVTFFDGATNLGTATLDGSGTASISAPGLTGGSHSITATFDGDSDFLTTTSAAATQVVNQSDTLATIAPPSPVVFGQLPTLSVTLSAVEPGSGTPTGTVTFYEGETPLGLATLSAGTATIHPTGLSSGSHSITAVYAGDSNFRTTTSASASLDVNQASTSTVLATPSAVVFGQSATLSATLTAIAPGSGTPTGIVTFFEGITLLGTATLDGSGVATFHPSNLSVGDHSITASYAGDSNFTVSDATAVTLTVTRSPSTATVAPTTAVVFGQSATLSATLTATAPGSGTPTGSVTFLDGAISLGNATLDGSGTASISASGLSVGAHAITITYAGDAGFLGSTSSVVNLVVSQASTTATVTPPLSIAFSQSATLTVTLAANSPGAGTPTGTVTFFDGATNLGTATLNGSASATITPSGFSVGTHTITATYAGDGNFLGSTSAIANLSVTTEASTTTITPVVSAATYGQAVTFTAAVASANAVPSTPTGTVTFFDGATSLGSGTLDGSGNASFTTSTLGAGSHTISAVYNGDADFGSSTSSTTTQVINQAGSAASLATPSSVVFGQAANIVATLTPVAPSTGTPTGIVTFFEGITLLGTATLDGSGVATFHPSDLSVGDHSITASYAGDSNFAASNATAVTLTVSRSPSTATVAPTTAVVFGQSATLSATLTATAPGSGTPTGSVTFFDGVTNLGTAPLDGSGTASISASGLSVGDHSITVSYAGDQDYLSSTSTARTLSVAKASTTATVSPPVSVVFGQSATLTATLAANSPGAGTPTGTVTFFDGLTNLGTATLNGSASASITVPGLSAGIHPIMATYAGDGNFLTTTSAVAILSVNTLGTTTTITPVVSASTFGQAVTFSAGVVANGVVPLAPTGTITFFDGAISLGSGTLDGTGHASFTTSSLDAGSHQISAVYNGDSAFSTSTSTTTTQVVNRASTTTTLATSASSTVSGQSVTLTATVVAVAPGGGVPIGTVSFFDSATLLGTASLDGSGSAVYQTSSLSVGSHSLTASYGGVPNDSPSTSSSKPVSVSQASSTVALITSNPVRTYGQAVTFTATVSAAAPGSGVPSGSVTFYNGSTPIGSYNLTGNSGSSSVASVTLSSLDAGTLAITASYSGSPNFLVATSPAITEVVSPASTSTSLTTANSQVFFGEPQTLVATVNVVAPGAGTPTGKVDYFDGSNLLGSAPLINGVATLTTTGISQGSRRLTASLAASNNFLGSTSSPVSILVIESSTSAVLTGPGASVVGQPVTFRVTVQPIAPATGIPQGVILFEDGATLLGLVPLNSQGVAKITVSDLGVGSHSIRGIYAGDGKYTVSAASPLSVTVSRSASISSVSAPSPSGTSQAITFSASVVAQAPGMGIPTGSLTFFDGSTSLGSAVLVNGSATLTTDSGTLAIGQHPITISYPGDGNFGPSTSTVASLTVVPSYSGAVYLDLNANGLPDPGEPGLAGRVVYADVNHNGAYDSGDPTATTDASGHFILFEVTSGTVGVFEATQLDTSSRYVVDQFHANPDGSLAIGVVPISPIAPVPVVPNPFVSTPGTDPNTAFVQSLYRAVLSRNGGVNDVASWVARLNSGATRTQVSQAFVNSTEHRQDQVAAYYHEFLNRTPDSSSTYWVNQLQHGVSEEQVVQGFLNSPEYQAAHKDPTLFVRDLYLEVLGRQGDEAGIAGWVGAMASGVARKSVTAAFVRSAEAAEQIVESFYVSYLHRPTGGVASNPWTLSLETPGGSATKVAIGILASNEFFQDSQNRDGKKS
ncbi:Ig-like domain repeat protein (plasmid) [Tundrisphaera lichenicola]|uniref:Ig-like domain repeat protein n=1 Tax=Tundrisphaera lichenicola TaxID=2029860 RepID=UPI003EB81011